MSTRRYCLRCLETLPGSDRCPVCGYTTRTVDRLTYWNRVPRLVRAQLAVQLTAAVLAVAVGLAFLAPASGPGAGWFFLLPAGFALAVWKTAAKLTRHEPYFRPTVVWSAALMLSALVLGRLVGPGFYALALLVGPVVAASRWGRHWKRRAIETGEL